LREKQGHTQDSQFYFGSKLRKYLYKVSSKSQ